MYGGVWSVSGWCLIDPGYNWISLDITGYNCNNGIGVRKEIISLYSTTAN